MGAAIKDWLTYKIRESAPIFFWLPISNLICIIVKIISKFTYIIPEFWELNHVFKGDFFQRFLVFRSHFTNLICNGNKDVKDKKVLFINNHKISKI